jgi:hypothetical protein
MALVALVATAGCDDEQSPPAEDACATLFGVPADMTGLGDDQCRPECSCDGQSWQAATYGSAEIEALEQREWLDPPDSLQHDPYQNPDAFQPEPDRICALLPASPPDGGYRVQPFDDEQQADAAGATLTHYGACGRCSSLQDLAVYIRYPDLTQPVRACGVEGMSSGKERNIECLQELGFTLPCAEIWYFNTLNTRTKCLEVCFAALTKPYHEPDGSLNPCIQCDEDTSGPVFKAVAGRTRRNSGLPSALCRPCSTVRPVTHDYP